MTLEDKLINAPCPFCTYNGPGYFQKGTHASACPYYSVGGKEQRISFLAPFIIDLIKQYVEAVAKREREFTKIYVLYDARAKGGDTDKASIYVTASSEAEAREDGQDEAWQDGIWYEYDIINEELINGVARWDLPPTNYGKESDD
jgi:hypothetical protein